MEKNFKCASINNEAWPPACLIARGMLMAMGRAVHALTPVASKHSPERRFGCVQGFVSPEILSLDTMLTEGNPGISSANSLEVEYEKILVEGHCHVTPSLGPAP